MKVNNADVQRQAVATLAIHTGSHPDLISLALRGENFSFYKVIKMVHDIVVLLVSEQTDDDDKKGRVYKDCERAGGGDLNISGDFMDIMKKQITAMLDSHNNGPQ